MNGVQAQNNKYFEKHFDWSIYHNPKKNIYVSDNQFAIVGSHHLMPDEYLLTVNKYGEEMDYHTFKKDEWVSISITNALPQGDNYIMCGVLREDIDSIAGFVSRVSSQGEVKEYYVVKNKNSMIFDFVPIKNGYMAVGKVELEFDSFDYYPYLLKLDEDLNKVWDTIYTQSFSGDNHIRQIEQAEDGGFYMLINFNQTSFGGEVYLMKTDSMGVKEWIEYYAFGGNRAHEFIKRKDGGFVVVVESSGFGKTRLLFTNEVGEVQDTIDHYFYQLFDFGGIIQLEDSSFVMSARGRFDDETSPYDGEYPQLVKLDQYGNELWNRVYPYQEKVSEVNDLLQTEDGGFMILAEKNLKPEGQPYVYPSIYLIKTNCMGFINQPKAEFDYFVNDWIWNLYIQTENLSEYVFPDSIDGGHFVWDFGDGSPLNNEFNPKHNYDTSGIYEVKLTAIVCNDTSRVSHIICVGKPDSLYVDFDYLVLETQEIQFNNQSQFAHIPEEGGTYLWDFGDGSTSTNIAPIHQYTKTGTYTVSLTLTLCDISTTIQKEIFIDWLGLDDEYSKQKERKLKIYPNPVDGDVLYIEVGGDLPLRPADTSPEGRILIYNTLGQVVLGRENSRIFSERKTKIDVGNLPGGVYFVAVEIGGEQVVEKVVVN